MIVVPLPFFLVLIAFIGMAPTVLAEEPITITKFKSSAFILSNHNYDRLMSIAQTSSSQQCLAYPDPMGTPSAATPSLPKPETDPFGPDYDIDGPTKLDDNVLSFPEIIPYSQIRLSCEPQRCFIDCTKWADNGACEEYTRYCEPQKCRPEDGDNPPEPRPNS